MPKHDMVRSIVLPHRLCTVRTVDGDVRARRVFRRILGCAVLEWGLKPTIRLNLSLASGSNETSVAQFATTESARILPNLASRSASSGGCRGKMATFVVRSSSMSSKHRKMCNPTWPRNSFNFFSPRQSGHCCFVSLPRFELGGFGLMASMANAAIPVRIVSIPMVFGAGVSS